MPTRRWSLAMIVLLFLIACCGGAISQDAAPYAFSGIVLDSREEELPEIYKALFDSSDCRYSKLGQRPVKQCGKTFQANTLPGLKIDINNSVHLSLTYISGRLQQFVFGFPRDDYESFVTF